MKKYSNLVDEFLINYVIPKMNLKEYNEENIGDIVDFMFNEIEGPLVDKEEANIKLTKAEKDLLNLVSMAITEITTRDDWF